jgi:hypothetical protein
MSALERNRFTAMREALAASLARPRAVAAFLRERSL